MNKITVRKGTLLTPGTGRAGQGEEKRETDNKRRKAYAQGENLQGLHKMTVLKEKKKKKNKAI